ncbi:MAG TPA: PilZ domain-containing protein [Thermoanaerobaculia bacterium]
MRNECRTVPRYFLIPAVPALVEGTPARVVDMGIKGARLEVRRPFEPGATVDLVIDSIPIKATVLWCQIDALNFSHDHDGYLAGVAFSQASTAVDELLTEISSRGGAIRIEEMRSHDRYRITAPLTGSFGDIAPVSIVDISVAGARIALLKRVIAGQTETLRFQVDDNTGPISVDAKIMWCRPSPIIREHYAGLSIDGQEDILRPAIHRLCTRNEARIDLDSLKRKFDALRLVSGMSDRTRKIAV